MPNFNIIGNGFDLYHGLPSSYYYFACYLLSVDEKVYFDLADMYGFAPGLIHHFHEEFDAGIDNIGYWREFEKKLGYLSSEWVENSLLDDLGFDYTEAVDLPIEVPNHVKTIRKYLSDWIRTTVDTEQNFKIIGSLLGENKVQFSPLDAFLSFNYTHTLEKVYNTTHVMHIHGECNPNIECSDLVIGHGNDNAICKMESDIAELMPYYYEQPARNRIREYQFEMNVLKNLRKPVKNCMAKLELFANKMEIPDTICVYGFSLSDVDAPYIYWIRRKWPSCKWRFSYYSDKDKDSIQHMAKSLCLEPYQYEMFQFANQMSSEIEQRIVEANKINIYPTLEQLRHTT